MNIGTGIKEIRKILGMQQVRLAEMCSITQTSLSLIEKGAHRPSHKTVKKICQALNIPEYIIYILSAEDLDLKDNKTFNSAHKLIKGIVMKIVHEENLVLVD